MPGSKIKKSKTCWKFKEKLAGGVAFSYKKKTYAYKIKLK